MRWPGVIALAIVAVAPVARAQQLPDPEDTLRRTQDRVFADLARLPRYTCVQTITRRYYRPRSEARSCKALISEHDKRTGELSSDGWDRLRLEVAIADGQNVFSWVGAPRFEEDNFGELAGHGPLGSGDFGSFLDSVLHLATIRFRAEKVVNGRRLLEYSYDMPQNKSGYQVLTSTGWVPTAYAGTLLLDAKAADVASLTVRTAELPESNPACQANSEVKYQRTAIHDTMVLIPRETRLNTIDRAGSETLSLTTYEKCREYASKSRMLVSAPVAPDAAAPAPPAPLLLSPDLHFEGRVLTSIDSDTAAAGDPIEGVLRTAIHDKKNNLLFPAGARLHGRLTRLEHRNFNTLANAQSILKFGLTGSTVWNFESFRVGMRWESIQFNGETARLHAAPQIVPDNKFVAVIAEEESPDDRIFLFHKQHLHLEQFDWNWITVAPAGGEGHSFTRLPAAGESKGFPRTVAITDGVFPIPADSSTQFKIPVPSGAIGVQLEGTFSTTGGFNGVDVSLFSSDEFANLQKQEPARALYESGRTREGTVKVDLPPAAGIYYLVFSNNFPLSTPEVVQASLRLHYRF